jgi:flagellin-like protein
VQPFNIKTDEEQRDSTPPGGYVHRTQQNRGVATVIGVILMVAITVILAAVVATFVLGLGDQVSNTAPQATFTAEYNDTAGQLTVTHSSGATLQAGQVKINGQPWADVAGIGDGSELSAGDSVTVAAAPGDTVRITWVSEDGTDSTTLKQYRVPE